MNVICILWFVANLHQPVLLREKPLGLNEIEKLLEDFDVDMEEGCIEVKGKDIRIKNENGVLVVEGNVSDSFQKIQKRLTEQYKLV